MDNDIITTLIQRLSEPADPDLSQKWGQMAKQISEYELLEFAIRLKQCNSPRRVARVLRSTRAKFRALNSMRFAVDNIDTEV